MSVASIKNVGFLFDLLPEKTQAKLLEIENKAEPVTEKNQDNLCDECGCPLVIKIISQDIDSQRVEEGLVCPMCTD